MQQQFDRDDLSTRRLALSLGWFSIGLGVAELTAPHAMARLIGIREGEHTAAILRAFGAREIGAGIAILARPDSAAAVWSRVGGDAVDLAYLGTALRPESFDRSRAAAATAAVLGVAAIDVLCARRLGGARGGTRAHQVRAAAAITVNRPIEQVYAFWRRFENLPQFMRHLQSVETLSDTRSRWTAKGPGGMSFDWEAEVVGERDQEHIAWRSLPGGDMNHRGIVRFESAPGARGTEVHVEMEYQPPAGSVGRAIGWLFGRNPEQQLMDDLRRFKQLLETGEITVSDGPGLWRPARPAASPERARTLAGVQP